MPYKRSDSKYWWITIAGVRQSSGTDDYKRAKFLEDRGNAEAWERRHRNVAPEKTWDEACLQWFEENKGLKSISEQAYTAKWWKPHLTGLYLSEITKEKIHAIMTAEKSPSVLASPRNSTINRLVVFVAKIIRHAGGSVPRFVRYPEPKGRDRWLTPKEWADIVEVMPADLRHMATFSLATGLRQANVIGLRWEWVRENSLIIPAEHTKTGDVYGIPLNRIALGVLEERRKESVRSLELAFLLGGKPAYKVALHRAWNRAVRASRVPKITYHGLRHTFASWLIQAGVPWEITARLGCWKAGGMVNRYTHLSVDHLRPYSEMICTFFTRQSQAVDSKQEIAL